MIRSPIRVSRLLSAAVWLISSWVYGSAARAQAVDPRGPIASTYKVVVNDQGVQAPDYKFVAPEEKPWQPQWIWLADASAATPIAADFRRTFELPQGATITSALAKVSADRVYRLWLNGHLISRGPSDPGSDEVYSTHWTHQWLYTAVDLTPYLRPGRNVLAVEVFTTGLLSSYSLGTPGLAFEATIVPARGAPVMVTSGDGWEARTAESYSIGPLDGAGSKSAGVLLYDARQSDAGWREASYADTSWAAARKIDSVWGTLTATQIPPQMEVVWPVAAISHATANVTAPEPFTDPGKNILVRGNGAFSVDFDRVLSAFVSIKVRGAAGTVITLQPSETKTDPHPRRPMQVTLRAGETTFEYPEFSAFSTVRVTVSHATAPVRFDDVRATFVSQPVAYRGSFESSDPFLNRLWLSARWLTQICMQDQYLDSPNNQEPLGDVGDYLIEALENDYAFGEQALTRQDLRQFAAILDHAGSVNFHTSYALLWLQMLMNYYDASGDAALLRELKPTADRLLDHFAGFTGKDGLLSEAPNYMFMDWVTIGGFATHHPPAEIGTGYLTAFYYKALGDGARLAALTGDGSREAHYEEQRGRVLAAFNRELWDESVGLYRDGKPFQNHQPLGPWLPADKDIVTHSPHVNALAVLYDLAPKDRQKAILDRVFLTPPLNVQPYFMQFIFAAEAHAGVFDRYGWTQMQRWKINPETKTFSEDWNQGDLSHAWGGTPLIQMSARILGIEPAAPGYQRVSVSPQLSGLTFARGVVPTPLGDVSVAWSKTDSAFSLDLKTPTAAGIAVRLPETGWANGRLTIDGADAQERKSWDGQLVSLVGGQHRLVLQIETPEKPAK